MDSFKEGDSVRVQPFDSQKIWRTSQGVKPVSHRSFEVKLESGGVLRRKIDDTSGGTMAPLPYLHRQGL